MKMGNSHLHHKISPLGTESSGFNSSPIGNIKYNKYAYKIIFKPCGPSEDMQSVQYICEQAFQDEFACFRDCLYIAHYEDYCLALMLFERRIESVSGPINQEHIDILLSKYTCVVRPHNWYKLYDCKMDIYFSIDARANYRETVDNVVSMLEEPYKVVRHSFWSLCVYNTFEHARVTEAICKLSYPKDAIRMYLTRCLIYRK